MSARLRIVLALVLTAVLLGGAALYAVVAVADYRARQSPAGVQRDAAPAGGGDGQRIVFRSTDIDDGYGLVASVAVSDPRGERAISSTACDRVDSTPSESMCLRIDRGVLTTFSANLLSTDGEVVRSWPLPGLPSRTRLSPDGSLVGFTSFVSGESYGSIAFSTATRIARVDGTLDYGNLEAFTLLVDGQQNTAVDRNFWGVTFSTDPNVFYATAATGGSTWLVEGDLAARTLTTVHQTVECPSLSPDGTRIAFKKNVSTGTAHWTVTVLDLATGKETAMPDDRSIDDQVEWLDDSTLLYSVPREGTVGDSDVWSVAADGSGEPARFIEHASSPAVVR
jgi:hypothetical protein